jgi:exopolyphosphatase / guanosine-5'-triphosphate,3'-diphosphate pyrophosphatase
MSTKPGAVAAIDIGTNSTNLLIADGSGPIVRTVRITRLGAGVDATRRLAPEAITRTVDQLAEYRAEIDRHDARMVRAVATSASRDAANRDEFFDRAEAALGVRPELLSGEEEGRLAFAGAVGLLRGTHAPPWAVLDIGGGSTELMLGDDDTRATISIDVGAVRVTEQLLRGDPPRPEELTNALGLVHDHLDDVVREIPGLLEQPTFVGIAGTITVVAAIELGLATFDPSRVDGFLLTREAAEDVFRTLATEALADRVHNPGLPKERADVIVGGCCVLVAVMRRLHLPGIIVSTRGILDGIVAELLQRAA